jgi:hypothetical protein
VGADAVAVAEGNIDVPKSRGGTPDDLACRSHRGRRAGHVREGPPGTWETSSSPTAELRRHRQAKETKRGEMGGEESDRLVVPTKLGNRLVGPSGGKGATICGTA